MFRLCLKSRLRRAFLTLSALTLAWSAMGASPAPAQDVTGGDVTVSTDTPSSVYGGQATTNGSNVHDNKVTVTNGNIGVYASPGTTGRSVYGGDAGSYDGDVYKNEVTMSGGRVVLTVVPGPIGGSYGGEVKGGYSFGSGDAYENKVTISGGTVDDGVRGGHAYNGAAYGNQVNISGTAVIGDGLLYEGQVVGGFSDHGAAHDNTVIVDGGTINGYIAGGDVNDPLATGAADGNTVEFRAGTVKGDGIVGGSNHGSGQTSGNVVTLKGGTFDFEVAPYTYGGIYGGRNYNSAPNTASVTGNTVNIHPGVIILNGDIYGGYTNGSGGATGNTVNLYGGSLGAMNPGGSAVGVYGGHSSFGDGFTGNTLNVDGFRGSLGEVNNFQYYKFFIPASMAAGDTLLNITGLDPTDLTGSSVQSLSLDGASPLGAGDQVTLIDQVTGTFAEANLLAQKGASLLYEVLVEVVGGELVASLGGSQATSNYNPQSKSLAQVRVAGLTLLNQGADLAADQALSAAELGRSGGSDGPGGPAFFAASSLSNFSTETGSHVDSTGWSTLAGLAWSDLGPTGSGWTAGLFFETGRGSYDGYNSFANLASVHSSGDNEYFGGGLTARYRFGSGFRAEGSFRFGRLESDYQAEGYLGQVRPSFDLDANYTGAHLGVGYDRPLSDRLKLDLSAKYLWTRQNGQSARVLGDAIDFEAVNSHRARAGAQLEITAHQQVKPYVGAYLEYEFDGRAEAYNRTAGLRHQAPETKGATGVGELGLRVDPGAAGGLNLDFSLQGHTGRRDGVSGNFTLNWAF